MVVYVGNSPPTILFQVGETLVQPDTYTDTLIPEGVESTTQSP